MDASITINQRDLGRVLSKINKLASMDFSGPLQKSAALLKKEQQDNFAKQGAFYQGGGFVRVGGAFSNRSRATTRSSSWAPLASSTRKDRVRQGYPAARPILERTRKLRRGFKEGKASKSQVSITNNVSYAAHHQYGTDRIPQRRIMGFTRKSIEAIRLTFSKHITEIIKS